jgi:LysM repeat protein
MREWHNIYILPHSTKSRVLFLLTLLIALTFLHNPQAKGTEKDTFSISLVQEATVKKTEGKEVAFERYKVKKGDHLWQILRQRGLLKRPDINELLSALKRMNKSLTNLDLIHPGQTILIPLKIIPKKTSDDNADTFFQESIMGISSLEDVSCESHLVQPGDNLTMIIYSTYKIPGRQLYDDYLQLVQKLNPTIKDLDVIYPNQVIRLPIYSPQIAKMPIEKPQEKKISLKETKAVIAPPTQKPPKTLSLRQELRDIFNLMGEEWVDTGEQFIPLKSGGHVNLKADFYPTISLRNGRVVIIDIKNELPEDISLLIESDWEEYRVVHLAPHDNLRAAIDKILAASAYYKILHSGEIFRVRSDVDITLASDWVIIPKKQEGDTPGPIVTLTLITNHTEQTPSVVKSYLENLGIKVIDYPDLRTLKKVEEEIPVERKIPIEKERDFQLPRLLLSLVGQSFSSEVKIPVYQSEGAGFNLIIHADIFFNRRGKDCIIDTTGLSPDIVALLEKHQFRVLSLADEKDPFKGTELILDFLGVQFESKPHDFPASARDEARNIMLTISGISFYDQEKNKIFATDKTLPEELVSFLNARGYHLLEL